MTVILRKEEQDIEARLAELDLTVSELQEVARAAYLAKASCSPLHPPTFPGTSAWGAAVYTLRSRKLPHGWRRADPGNFSITINDARRFYVVIATGDELAGRSVGKVPTTKSPKGLKTEAAVKATRQLTLFPDEAYEELQKDADLAEYKAWFLLINISKEFVALEVSSPLDMKRGKITSWHERIIVPGVSFDQSVSDDDDDGFNDDINIDVQPLS